MERYTETDCSKCGVPVNVDLDPQGDLVRYDDAQRALDAEREKVKELEEQLRLANCDQVNTENDLNDVTSQLATLRAQLRQVEGERNIARRRVDELESREIDVEILKGDLTTLRQLVEALPALDMRFDSVAVGPLGCWTVGGVAFGKLAEANAYSALLQYRATLAAKDAEKVSTSIIGKQVLPSQWNKNAGVSGDVS